MVMSLNRHPRRATSGPGVLRRLLFLATLVPDHPLMRTFVSDAYMSTRRSAADANIRVGSRHEHQGRRRHKFMR